MRTSFVILVMAAIAAVVPAGSMPAHAYPTSINFIPTADTLKPREVLFEVGRIGYRSLADDVSTDAAYFQLGVCKGLEIGADTYSDGESSETCFNGKFRFFDRERDGVQAAVGFMDVSRAGKPTFYLVASRQSGRIRPHFGLMGGSYSRGAMAGLDFDVGRGGWVGVDYLPGSANHLRVGVGHSLGSSTFLQVSYGRPNSAAVSDEEIAVTLSFSLDLSRAD